MRSEVSVLTRTGQCIVPYTQSLHHFSTKTTQTLIHPDYFDDQANWYRLISSNGKSIAISVSPEGCVQWSSSEAIESSRVQDIIQRLLISVPSPEEAMKALPHELEERFRALSPLVHIASLSLGEALIKAIIRQVITAMQRN